MPVTSTSELALKVKNNVKKVIVGKDRNINFLTAALLAGGHILIEDVPGTGKTMLIKAFAASFSCSFKRIQFTPDLLPSDITGIKYFNMKTSEFEFLAGPVFANIILADEINRVTPKTQAGLLECMEERQVTTDGETHKLPLPFMVTATQNPIESMGVFPLPEAELDRFLIKPNMEYPSTSESLDILSKFSKINSIDSLQAAATKEEIFAAQIEINQVFVHEDIYKYIVSIVEETRRNESVILGISPRGMIALLKISKAIAAISGRKFVTPDDIKLCAVPTLSHRLVLKTALTLKRNAGNDIIDVSLNYESMI